MRVSLDRVRKGRRGEALPETSLTFSSGTVTLAVAETEQRPTVLGLLSSGRMRPDSGTVTLDGTADSRGIRRRVALVDAPAVSEPAPNVSVAGLVGEELMFAGRRADPFAARAWLADRGLRDLASTPLADVSPEDRLRMLCELALLRPGVDGLVVVAPDRHGGAPLMWWRLLHEYADRGAAVLVIAGRASEWAIDHQTAIDDIAAGEEFVTEALGEVSERQAAFAQSGGASLTGAETGTGTGTRRGA